jgi:hypothetical protein
MTMRLPHFKEKQKQRKLFKVKGVSISLMRHFQSVSWLFRHFFRRMISSPGKGCYSHPSIGTTLWLHVVGGIHPPLFRPTFPALIPPSENFPLPPLLFPSKVCHRYWGGGDKMFLKPISFKNKTR